MAIPIPIIGPTYVNASLPVSNQVTRNFFIEVNPPSNEIVSFRPFPGLKPFATTDSNPNRGSGQHEGVYYTISGPTLYSVDSSGVSTSRGTIEGTGRCVLKSDGPALVITTGIGKPFTFDGTTLTQGDDPDLPNAATVTFTKRRVVYDGNNGDVVFADLDNALNVDSANVAIAESEVDDTLAVIQHKNQVLVCGATSIEPWYSTGTGNPPYSPVENTLEQIGLHAIYSLASDKDFVYLLASDLVPYRLSGLNLQPIGNPAIGQAIRNYSDSSDAIGMTFRFDSMSFYLLTFPIGNETWLYNEQSGQWTNLANGTNGDQHLISSHEFIYNKHLIADRTNGNVYELGFDTFTDNGLVIQRQRDTIAIDSRMLGVQGIKVFMDRLELEIETGVSLVGAEAQIIMQYSDDNGRTWSSERFQSIGQQGDYTRKIQWLDLGDFYTRMFRFTMTDPVNWVIKSLYADMELANWKS